MANRLLMGDYHVGSRPDPVAKLPIAGPASGRIGDAGWD